MVKFCPNFCTKATSASKSIAFRRGTFYSNVHAGNGRLRIRLMLRMVMRNSFNVNFIFEHARSNCFVNVMDEVFQPIVRVQYTVQITRMTRDHVELGPFLVVPRRIRRVFQNGCFFSFRLMHFSRMIRLRLINLLVVRRKRKVRFSTYFFRYFYNFLILRK